MESFHVLAPSYALCTSHRRTGQESCITASCGGCRKLPGRFSVARARPCPIHSNAAGKPPIVTSSHSRTVRARTIRIAAAVIRDEGGRLLLVRKRGTKAFMQAGGKIEPGELPPAALARELREELGIVVDPGAASHLGVFSAPAANEPDARVEAELFELSITGEPIPAAEIEEMIWLNPALASGMDLAPLTADIVLPRYGRQP
ncbi:NUDIX domain-containing protein [Mesorhizobium sp. M2A.F.Ca.ET.042.01.1.1]|nr:NUDIX domain-containing protein [Mesorhizobium sp. M2A.F.Ca.ET.042.01.1.1]